MAGAVHDDAIKVDADGGRSPTWSEVSSPVTLPWIFDPAGTAVAPFVATTALTTVAVERVSDLAGLRSDFLIHPDI